MEQVNLVCELCKKEPATEVIKKDNSVWHICPSCGDAVIVARIKILLGEGV